MIQINDPIQNIQLSQILIAVIAATPPTIMAFFSYKKSVSNSESIHDIHISINSRMDELIKVTGVAGVAEGRDLERSERQYRKKT